MFEKVLTTPTAQLGRASRLVILQVKLWTHCARLLKKNRAGQQAAALSYHTIFGLIPLSIVVLLIFQSFGAYSDIGEKLKNLAYEQLQLTTIEYDLGGRTVKLTEHLDDIVSKVFTGFNEGTIALVSAVIIIWAALALLGTIERSFNSIWGIGRGRAFLQRVINYWAVLTLGPLLLGVGIYIGTRYATINELQRTVLLHIAPVVLSYIIATTVFFLLYYILPNTKVETRAAIWGAAVAAAVWTLAKLAFRLYVTQFIPFNKIYGVLGLVPLGVFWIYVSWLIVLFGLQLTFTTQHLKPLDAAEIAAAAKRQQYFIANELTVINIVREITAAFASGSAPVEAEVLSSKLNIPAEFTEKLLRHLVACGLAVRVSEPRDGFMPAKEPGDIRISDISQAVAQMSFAQSPANESGRLRRIMQTQRGTLAQYTLSQILGASDESEDV